MIKKELKRDAIDTTWIIGTLTLVAAGLIACASLIAYIDPLFHYHKPLDRFSYPIHSERYQNDGITRHFEYDGIITGTSMTENFKTSEADAVFDATFIKVPFSGGRYKEMDENLRRAYRAGKQVRYVIRCLDYSSLVQDKDAFREDEIYPTYLYNDNPFDDVKYILNKSMLGQALGVISHTRAGGQTTSFDDYVNWNASYTFDAKTVLASYALGEKAESSQILSDDERRMVLENIRQNVTDLADEHPETAFYLFFPPYSICYWDVLNNDGKIDWRIDAEQVAIEEILKHPNIRLYSFCDDFELICNLNHYKDQAHYGEWVNSWMLEWMRDGKGLLTADNYEAYLEKIRNFYHSYDYGSLRR